MGMAGILSVVATLCKETGATVLLFFIAQTQVHACAGKGAAAGSRHQRKRARMQAVASGALFCAILAVRKWLTGDRFGPEFSRVDNPFYYLESSAERLLSFAVVHSVYARLLVWPTALSADYSFDCIPVASSLADRRLIGSALLYGALGWLLSRDLWRLRNAPKPAAPAPRTPISAPLSPSE